MDNQFQILKQQYNEIGSQIKELRKKQRSIREKMSEVCSHENPIKLDSDFILSGIDETDLKYKCQDCFEYFTEEELRELRKNRER